MGAACSQRPCAGLPCQELSLAHPTCLLAAAHPTCLLAAAHPTCLLGCKPPWTTWTIWTSSYRPSLPALSSARDGGGEVADFKQQLQATPKDLQAAQSYFQTQMQLLERDLEQQIALDRASEEQQQQHQRATAAEARAVLLEDQITQLQQAAQAAQAQVGPARAGAASRPGPGGSAAAGHVGAPRPFTTLRCICSSRPPRSLTRPKSTTLPKKCHGRERARLAGAAWDQQVTEAPGGDASLSAYQVCAPM